MSAEEYKTIIRQWVEDAWNNGNFSTADGLYAENYILHDSSQTVHASQGIQQFISTFRAGFPNLHLTIEDMIAEGDKVTWRFTARGTQNGELMGIPPTGRQVTVTGMVISRFANDKWQEDWSNFDALGMLQQLGVIPRM
jgi:steroid delta-isomerase-like uncharacterized protein